MCSSMLYKIIWLDMYENAHTFLCSWTFLLCHSSSYFVKLQHLLHGFFHTFYALTLSSLIPLLLLFRKLHFLHGRWDDVQRAFQGARLDARCVQRTFPAPQLSYTFQDVQYCRSVQACLSCPVIPLHSTEDVCWQNLNFIIPICIPFCLHAQPIYFFLSIADLPSMKPL